MFAATQILSSGRRRKSRSLVADTRRTIQRRLLLEPLERRHLLAAGDLDLSFGTAGRRTVDFAFADDAANAIALQPDGKIVLAGTALIGGDRDFAIARFTPEGQLDTTFGVGGRVAYDFAAGDDLATSVVVRPDGRILIGGQARIGQDDDFALLQVMPNGTLDASFGVGGKVTRHFGFGHDGINALHLNSDGSFLAAGHATTGGHRDFAVIRFNASGGVDSSFGVNGVRTVDFAGSHDVAFAMRVQPDGKIVVAGTAFVATDFDFALARLLPNGTLDASFSGDGKVTTNFGNLGIDTAASLVLQPDGKIVAAGWARIGADDDFALARYSSSGDLDTSFDGDGKRTLHFGFGNDAARAVVMQPDGKLLVAGAARIQSDDDFAVVRLLPNGALDNSFASSGIRTHSLSSGDDFARAMALQPDGRILVAGKTLVGNDYDLAVVRYENDVGPQQDALEPNDTPQTARNLGPLAGEVAFQNLSIHAPRNDDWYQFRLPAGLTQAHFVGIVFQHARGDLDIELVSASGVTLSRSDSTADVEVLSLGGFASGDYYLRVYGFAGATNPSYTLAFNLPQAGGDAREPNDSLQTATILGAIAGTFTEERLSLHAPGNDDWYQFQLTRRAGEEHQVRVTFRHEEGDVDLELTNRQGQVLRRSDSTSNRETISLAGLDAEVYYVRVYGFSQATNPNYTLSITAPASGNDYEPNQTPQAAAALGVLQGAHTYSNLAIEPSGDDDWFRFDTVAEGTDRHGVLITFQHSNGDVDLELYNAQGNLLRASRGVGNSENVSLEGLPAGAYFVRVFGFAGAVNREYVMTIAAPSQSLQGGPDALEPNNSRASAHMLGRVNRQLTRDHLSIHEPGDVDWFQFEITAGAQEGHAVGIVQDPAGANLDVELYDQQRNLLRGASTAEVVERVSLANLPAGNYYARVFARDSGTNSNYRLVIAAPGTEELRADASEPNDMLQTAADLGRVSRNLLRTGLSIHTPADRDWFRFELTDRGSSGQYVAAGFQHAAGDLRLSLYAPSQTLLGTSNSTNNLEVVSLNGLAAGDYYVLVEGVDGAVNPNYVLQIVGPGDGTVSADHLETNNDFDNATELGAISGPYVRPGLTLHDVDDEDWFRFELLGPATAEHALGILANSRQGLFSIELYDEAGDLLGEPTETGDLGEISLEGLAAGTYYARVFSPEQAIGTYALGMVAPLPSATSLLAPDSSEPNDTNTTARDLGVISGAWARTGLSIHAAGEEDWFRFQTRGPANESHRVTLNFSHAAGDLDITLVNPQGIELRESNGITDEEVISLAGLPAGEYYLRVIGFSGATNPHYTLGINAPEAAAPEILPDNHEPNNAHSSAYNLGRQSGSTTLSRLSLSAGDEDWFRIETVAAGGEEHAVGLLFEHALGDVDVELYDANQNRLSVSQGTDNFEEIRLTGLPAGAYYVRVYGYQGASNPEYTLAISTPRQDVVALAPDFAEPNDSRAEAFNLDQTLSRTSGQLANSSQPFGGGSILAALFDTFFGNDPNNIDYAAPIQFGTNPNAAPLLELGLFGGILDPFSQAVAGYNLGETAQILTTSGSNVDAWLLQQAWGPTVGNPNSYQGLYSPFQNFGSTLLGGAPSFNTPTSFPANPQFFGSFTPGIGNPGYTDWANTLTSVGLGGILDSNFGFYNPLLNFGTNYLQNAFPGQSYASTVTGLLNSLPGFGSGVQPLLYGALGPGTIYTPPTYQLPAVNPLFPYTIGPGFGGSMSGSPAFNFLAQNGFLGRGTRSTRTADGGSAAGVRVLSGLTIHSAQDVDWFRFQILATPNANHFVRIDFEAARGDLRLRLFDRSNSAVPVRESTQHLSFAEIPLIDLPPGEYFVQVAGFAGATSSNYTLSLNTPREEVAGVSPDLFEPNDAQAEAADLRNIDGNYVLTGLTLHQPNNDDWFRFRLTGTAAAEHHVRIDFTHALGDLDLELYGTAPQFLRRSAGTTDGEQISLQGLAAGEYWVRVLGHQGATNPAYLLSFYAPAAAALIGPDRFESPTPNNSFDQASDLREPTSSMPFTNLTIHAQDRDFYRFRTVANGSTADAVRIAFRRADGDLGLRLYDGQRNVLRESRTDADSESVSLNGLPAGAYFVEVFGEQGATNYYDLRFDTPALAAAPARNDWTVMVYITASDLEQAAFADINEMEALAQRLGASVQFAVLWDQNSETVRQANGSTRAGRTFETPVVGSTQRQQWGDTGRALIQGDTNAQRIVTPFERLGERNSAAPETLIEFVNWAVSAAPAERYALVLWDHGSGLWGSNLDYDGPNGRLNNDKLTTSELTSALDMLSRTTLAGRTRPFDVIAFDTCLNQMLEVAAAVAPYTEIYVASQEMINGDGYQYDTAFQVLASNPQRVTAEGLAGSLIQSFERQYLNDRQGLNTLSALRSANLSALTTALRGFADAVLSSATAEDWRLIRQAMLAATAMVEFPEYRDLGTLVRPLAQGMSLSASIRTAAANVLQAVENAVLGRTMVRSDVTGLSIYLPVSGPSTSYAATYTAFNNATRWSEFLQQARTQARTIALADVAAGTRSVQAARDWAEANDRQANAFPLRELIGPGHRFHDLSLHSAQDQDWFHFTTVATGTANDVLAVTVADSAGAIELALLTQRGDVVPGHTVSGRGTLAISLADLPAGPYYARIQSSAGPALYSLTIDAPASTEPHTSGTRGNNTLEKSHNLGVIHAASVLAGLSVRGGEESWFAFSTPRQVAPAPGTVRVQTAAGEVVLELFDEDGSRGTLQGSTVSLPYASGSGARYQIVVRSTLSSQPTAFTLTIAPPNVGVPSLDALPDQSVDAGRALNLVAFALDDDGDTMRYEVSGASGAAIHAATGEFSWTPLGLGSFTLTVRASDGAGNAAETPLQVHVRSPWRNHNLPLDVNGDFHISPADALVIINELLEPKVIDTRTGQLPIPAPASRSALDTNGDGFASAIDVLLVINRLISPDSTGEGEGDIGSALAESGILRSVTAIGSVARGEPSRATPRVRLAAESLAAPAPVASVTTLAHDEVLQRWPPTRVEEELWESLDDCIPPAADPFADDLLLANAH